MLHLVKTRSHRFVAVTLRVIPLTVVALVVHTAPVVLAEGPRLF
jgi:hypothetical protein